MNTNKCKQVTITTKINPMLTHYFMLETIVKDVSHYKCLGVHIMDTLNWSYHIYQLSSSENRALDFLICNLSYAPPATKLSAYKTLVL